MKTKLTREDFENYKARIIEGNKVEARNDLMRKWNDKIMLKALEEEILKYPKPKK